MMKIALGGIGKIARDQHVPSLAASPDWDLAATVSRSGTVEGIEAFTDMEALLAARPDIRVLSLCQPAGPRFAYAAAALRAGRHVMLEKPPGATLAECHGLIRLAQANRVTLFASWHSREAAMVAQARAWLADRTLRGAHITWREDIRHWHPGQDWVLDAGGMGVLDPGINALSILTEILPGPVHLTEATLRIPANRQSPIAAQLVFTGNVTAAMDWLQEGPQTWDIRVETDGGTLLLSEGGAKMAVDGVPVAPDATAPRGEYPGLYARFARLVTEGRSDTDLTPLVHVADAFLLGRRVATEAFHWEKT